MITLQIPTCVLQKTKNQKNEILTTHCHSILDKKEIQRCALCLFRCVAKSKIVQDLGFTTNLNNRTENISKTNN